MKACFDIRMTYAQYIMCKACTTNLPEQLIWNWDATQLISTKRGTGKYVCVTKKEYDNMKTPVSLVDKESLDIGKMDALGIC